MQTHYNWTLEYFIFLFSFKTLNKIWFKRIEAFVPVKQFMVSLFVNGQLIGAINQKCHLTLLLPVFHTIGRFIALPLKYNFPTIIQLALISNKNQVLRKILTVCQKTITWQRFIELNIRTKYLLFKNLADTITNFLLSFKI